MGEAQGRRILATRFLSIQVIQQADTAVTTIPKVVLGEEGGGGGVDLVPEGGSSQVPKVWRFLRPVPFDACIWGVCLVVVIGLHNLSAKGWEVWECGCEMHKWCIKGACV